MFSKIGTAVSLVVFFITYFTKESTNRLTFWGLPGDVIATACPFNGKHKFNKREETK